MDLKHHYPLFYICLLMLWIRLKASRARKLLQKKEEHKAAARAVGIDWHSDNTDDESPVIYS